MFLESIQNKIENSLLFKALLFMIIIFFIGAGYFTSTLFGGNPDEIVEVDGSSITNSQVQQRMDNMRQQMGVQFEQQYATDASKELLKQQITQQLINEQVLMSNVRKLGFTASDEQIKQWSREFEAFQLAGQYSADQARQVLIQNGWSEQQFKAFATDQIVRDQLLKGISESGFALDSEVAAVYRLQEQARDVRALRVPKAKFAEAAVITDEQISEYYEQNQSRFEQPERINLNYVRLSVAQLTEQTKATVTEQQVAEFYEQNKSKYQTKSEIQVAHILIDNSVDNAEQKAQSLLEQINGGADFAELAKTESSDTFSGENGGALDWVDAVAADENSEGTGWAPEFEAAALALQNVGDVTEVVETDFGFHIIKLLERRQGDVASLESVSEELKDELAKEQAEKLFYEKQTQLNEKLFEFGEDITQFAEQVGLAVQETGVFSEATANGLAANPVILERAFSSQILDSSEVSDMIDLGNNDIVYLSKKEYLPAAIKPLEDVKTQITETLRTEAAEANSKAFAEQVLAALEKGEATDTLLTEKELSWVENANLKSTDSGLQFDMISAIFGLTAPQDDNPVLKVEQLMSGDYAVIELKGVSYPDVANIDAAQKAQLIQLLSSSSSQGDLSNLLEDFRAKSNIKN